MKKPRIDYSEEAILNSRYLALPKIAQYVKIDPARYEKPKSVFKHLMNKNFYFIIIKRFGKVIPRPSFHCFDGNLF